MYSVMRLRVWDYGKLHVIYASLRIDVKDQLGISFGHYIVTILVLVCVHCSDRM